MALNALKASPVPDGAVFRIRAQGSYSRPGPNFIIKNEIEEIEVPTEVQSGKYQKTCHPLRQRHWKVSSDLYTVQIQSGWIFLGKSISQGLAKF